MNWDASCWTQRHHPGRRGRTEERRPRHNSKSFLVIIYTIRRLGQQGFGLKERDIVDRGMGCGCHRVSPDILYVQPFASRETPVARTRRVDSIGGVVLGMRNTLYNIDEAVRRGKGMSDSVQETGH